MRVSIPSEQTKVMRVPIALEMTIREMIQRWAVDKLANDCTRHSQSEDRINA